MKALFATPDWGRDSSSVRAGWWAKVAVEALALRSLSLGTWPKLCRDKCNPASIAAELRLPSKNSSDIKSGIVSAIREGLISPTFDRSGVLFTDRYFCEVGIGEIPRILKLCEKNDLFPAGILFQLDRKAQKTKKVERIPIVPVKKSRGRPKNPSDQESDLFHMWRKGLGKNARAVLDKKRLQSIRRALGFGFSMEDLRTSLTGWIAECNSDPWRMEKANRHEISLFLRDAARIEEGISYTQSPPSVDGLNEVSRAEMEARERRIKEGNGHQRQI